PAHVSCRPGFTAPRRAAGLLADPVLTGPAERAAEAGAPLPEALAEAADPDLALLTVVRLLEAWHERGGGAVDLPALLATDSAHRRRPLAVVGASPAPGDMPVARPEVLARR